MSADHYAVLGVERTATQAEIKAAFRKRASATHPDKAGGSHAENAAINIAYAVLSEPSKRDLYDRAGHTDPIENTARDFVISMFEALVEQDAAPELWHPILAKWCDEFRDKIPAERAAAQAKVASIEKFIGKFTTPEGVPNMAEAVLQRRLLAARKNLALLEQRIEGIDRIVEMISVHRLETPRLTKTLKAAFAGLRGKS